MRRRFQNACLALCLLSCSSAFGQEEWYDHYRNAKEAMAASDWRAAEKELHEALRKRNRPGLNVEEYGLKFVDYLPHYWLGVAYFNLGEFEKATQAFEAARLAGQIQKSSLHESFQRYERTLAALKQLRLARASLHAQSTAPSQRQLQEFENAIQRKDYKAAQGILNTLETAPSDSTILNVLRRTLLLARADPARAVASPEQSDGRNFQRGLDEYVAGNYATALQFFAEAEAENPNSRQAANWRKQTLATMARLHLKSETITLTETDTIFANAAPVIAFTSPVADRVEVRADSILIAGTASDDLGIQALEFSLNGKTYSDVHGLPIRLAPRSPNDAKNFPFQISLPLRLGENQIIVTARDFEARAEGTTYPKTVVRLRPWHQTPAFYVVASVMLLLATGSVVANVLIKRRLAFVNRYNPYIAGAPVRNEKMFFGREQLLQRIINTLPNNSLMLHGPRRIGKTSLQHQLKKRLENDAPPEYHYVPVFIDLQGVREEKFFLTMMEEIREACGPLPLDLASASRQNEYSARDFSAELQKILAHLQMRTTKRLKLVLQLDEVDTLNAYSARVNQQLRGIFMKSFAEHVVAVMSGSYIRKQWESEGSPWYNFFEEIAVPILETEEALALIREPVRGIFSYEHEAVERLLALSKCEPYRIQRLCVNVINHIVARKRRRVTAEDVEAVYAEIFSQETTT